MSIAPGSAALARSATYSSRRRAAVVGAVAGVLTLGATLVPAATFATGPAEGAPPLVRGELGEVPLEVPSPALPVKPPSATVTSELLGASAQVGSAPSTGELTPAAPTPENSTPQTSKPSQGGATATPAAPPTTPEKASAGREEGAGSRVAVDTITKAEQSLDRARVTSALPLAGQLLEAVAVTPAPAQRPTQSSGRTREKTQAPTRAVAASDDAFYTAPSETTTPLGAEVLGDASVAIDAESAASSLPLAGLGLALIPVALAGAAFAFRLRPAGGRHAA
ncbi:MAG: hypothetical protein ACT4PP_00365 [Sporichthyaceae bacterium]